MMKPIYFDPGNGLSLVILPESKESDAGHACSFQLYYGSPGNGERSLCDLNNYTGLISFDRASQEFHYTPGNRAISSEEILQVIACIKTKFSNS
jgi:hypothetical protein